MDPNNIPPPITPPAPTYSTSTRLPKIIAISTLTLAVIFLAIASIQALLTTQNPTPPYSPYDNSFRAPTLTDPSATPTPQLPKEQLQSYNNDIYHFSLQYPSTYTLKQDSSATDNLIKMVTLEKNATYPPVTPNFGVALIHGVELQIEILPNDTLTQIKKEYAEGTIFTDTTIAGKPGYTITFPEKQRVEGDTTIITLNENTLLKIQSMFGADSTEQEMNSYRQDYASLLHSLQFSDSIQTESGFMAYIKYTGGLCPNGHTCEKTKTIKGDGTVLVNAQEMKKLSATEIVELYKLIQQTDFTKIRQTAFTGTCPTAYDGAETIYTIATNHGAEYFSDCTYIVDKSLPLFKKLDEIFGE